MEVKNLPKIRSKILEKRKLQLEIKSLRKSYEHNSSQVLLDEIVNKTKQLESLK